MKEKLVDKDGVDEVSDSESTKSDERIISNRIKDDASGGEINKSTSVGEYYQK